MTYTLSPVSDTGTGVDAVLSYGPLLMDVIFSVDIAFTIQGTLAIDGLNLPHVQTLPISEPTVMTTKPIEGSLPYREFVGKHGRSVTVNGWTDDLAELESLRALADGQLHLLMLPTGDSFLVLVDVSSPTHNVANPYGLYTYSLSLQEWLEDVD
jgi:hypothetical protein